MSTNNKENKKICNFCGNNNYEGKYAGHLKEKHRKVINDRVFLRNVSKQLSAEQLEAVKKFALEIKDKK